MCVVNLPTSLNKPAHKPRGNASFAKSIGRISSRTLFKFGKYKGLPAFHVAQQYPGYIIWCIETLEIEFSDWVIDSTVNAARKRNWII